MDQEKLMKGAENENMKRCLSGGSAAHGLHCRYYPGEIFHQEERSIFP